MTTRFRYVRSLLILRSANNAVAFAMPVLAAVLSFVTYSLTGHSLDPAIIFTSLTLFQLLRLPLMFLRKKYYISFCMYANKLFIAMSFSSIADAANASERLYDCFCAELLDEVKENDPDLDVAIRVDSASFTWDAPPPEVVDSKTAKKIRKAEKAEKKSGIKVEVVEKEIKEDKIFQLNNINMEIPRGKLVAVVGPVGSGKSSLLQGIIGEMRRTSGHVTFGGSVGYCPQSAWIQNATIRENICFGRPFDEERYWKAIRDSCLEPDLDLLPNYDLTEVGEKGISLSGGQKQRLNICRAIYCNTDIQIFDDPLSALDAHVGKAVFQNVLQSSLQGKTRILVTHALHFLPYVDYVYVMFEGQIVERGTYAELISNEGAFARFVQEFGNAENGDKGEAVEEEIPAEQKAVQKKRRTGVAGAGLMQTEERNTGAVSGAVYGAYFRAGKGGIVIPLLIFWVIMQQGSTVMSSYWLVYWQEM